MLVILEQINKVKLYISATAEQHQYGLVSNLVNFLNNKTMKSSHGSGVAQTSNKSIITLRGKANIIDNNLLN